MALLPQVIIKSCVSELTVTVSVCRTVCCDFSVTELLIKLQRLDYQTKVHRLQMFL